MINMDPYTKSTVHVMMIAASLDILEAIGLQNHTED